MAHCRTFGKERKNRAKYNGPPAIRMWAAITRSPVQLYVKHCVNTRDCPDVNDIKSAGRMDSTATDGPTDGRTDGRTDGPTSVCGIDILQRSWPSASITAHEGGAENAGVENAGVENTGAIIYGKPSNRK